MMWQAFSTAVLKKHLPAPAGLVHPMGGDAASRFDIYRNNVHFSLQTALQDSYPLLREIVGAAEFERLCAAYILSHPPRSPVLTGFGDQMPTFLTDYAALQHLGYLPDMARLERDLLAAYHAADHTPVDIRGLLENTENPGEIRFEFAPSASLMESDWPLMGLYTFLHDEGPSPDMRHENILIYRDGFIPAPLGLTDDAFAILSELKNGNSISGALQSSPAALVEQTMQQVFKILITTEIISDMKQ